MEGKSKAIAAVAVVAVIAVAGALILMNTNKDEVPSEPEIELLEPYTGKMSFLATNANEDYTSFHQCFLHIEMKAGVIIDYEPRFQTTNKNNILNDYTLEYYTELADRHDREIPEYVNAPIDTELRDRIHASFPFLKDYRAVDLSVVMVDTAGNQVITYKFTKPGISLYVAANGQIYEIYKQLNDGTIMDFYPGIWKRIDIYGPTF